MKKVIDVVVKFTLDAEEGAGVLDSIWAVWGKEWPEWLVGINTVSQGALRSPTEEECETMAWEKDEVMAEPEEAVPGTAMAEVHIDQQIDEGLACPHCGSRRFRTLQRLVVQQNVTNGDWHSFGDTYETETRVVDCAQCEAILWQAPDYEG